MKKIFSLFYKLKIKYFDTKNIKSLNIRARNLDYKVEDKTYF